MKLHVFLKDTLYVYACLTLTMAFLKSKKWKIRFSFILNAIHMFRASSYYLYFISLSFKHLICWNHFNFMVTKYNCGLFTISFYFSVPQPTSLPRTTTSMLASSDPCLLATVTVYSPVSLRSPDRYFRFVFFGVLLSIDTLESGVISSSLPS